MAQSNIMGDKLRYLHALYQQQRGTSANNRHLHGLQLNRAISHVNSLITAKYSIPGLKHVLGTLGMFGGWPRWPFLLLKEAEALEIDQAMLEAEKQWQSLLLQAQQ
jgi:dihydrodipicolinate synthase/N-acetylneuraminate lyase